MRTVFKSIVMLVLVLVGAPLFALAIMASGRMPNIPPPIFNRRRGQP